MTKQISRITLNNTDVDYALRQSRRARNLRVSVFCDASVVVSAPFWCGRGPIENFLRSKANWIVGKIEHFKRLGKTRLKLPAGGGHFREHRVRSLEFVSAKVLERNRAYNFKYNKVAVKNNKSRWGSCSKAGNLNFNYRILFLPAHLAEYIVAHELCHLKHFNHSKNFWALVAESVPNFRERVRELKKLAVF